MTQAEGNEKRIAELEADNARLRGLLEDRGVPAELRHRTRRSLAILRAIIRKSAEARPDTEDYVAHLEERLDAIARAQADADQAGSISLSKILRDEFLHHGRSEGARLSIAGPDILFTPRAGQVFALALHELAINAVEYGAIGSDTGRVEVAWHLDQADHDTLITFTWTEHLTRANRAHSPVGRKETVGFGTEVLTRMLPYELGAKTQLSLADDGYRCVIKLPLLAKVGRTASQADD